MIHFHHNGIKRNYHKRKIVINHSEHHCSLGVYHLKRTDSEKSEKTVEKAVVFKNSHPGISPEQEVHPHGKHYEHEHRSSDIAGFSRHDICKGISHQKADNRCNKGKKKAFNYNRNIIADADYVLHRKSSVAGSKRKICYHYQRNNNEYCHKDNIRKRRITGFCHFSSSVILCMI